MHIAFAHHEPIDPSKARWVAMTRSIAAVVRAHPVTWYAADSEARVRDYAAKQLGLELPDSLRIRKLPSVHRLAGLTWNRVFFGACARAVARDKPEVLWLRSDKLAAFFAARAPGPMLYEAHLVGPLWGEDRGAGASEIARLEATESRIYARASAVAAITAGLLDEIRARYSFDGPADVVPSGVDMGLFKPAWNGGDGATVVYIGTLQFWKGLDTLLRAIALAPGLRLRVVGGGGEEETRLRARVAELGLEGRVEITGRQPQTAIAGFVKDAACAVHPLPPGHSISARFTSPLKVFEYMAMALPIVAADLPSTREVLTDGVNAKLYEAGNAESLAQAMQAVAGNAALARGLSIQAARDAQQYSYAARSEKLIALCRSAIGQQK